MGDHRQRDRMVADLPDVTLGNLPILADNLLPLLPLLPLFSFAFL
jgi:hypothetical protein